MKLARMSLADSSVRKKMKLHDFVAMKVFLNTRDKLVVNLRHRFLLRTPGYSFLLVHKKPAVSLAFTSSGIERIQSLI